MFLYYIRHGRPTYSPDALKPVGVRQAESIGRRVSLHGLSRVFASSSNRAIETARPAAEICEREIEVLDWCNEGHAWEYTARPAPGGGMKWAFTLPAYRRLFLSPEVLALGDRWYDHPAFADTRFREGCETVGAQADAFLADLGYVHDRARHVYSAVRHNDDRVALFAHEGFGKLFLSLVLDIPYPIFCMRFDLFYATLTVVEFNLEDDGTVVPSFRAVNDTGHLLHDGLSNSYPGRLPV